MNFLLRDPQAIRHGDHIDAVDEGFVVLVRAEALPLRLVGMGHDDPGERDRADVLRADVIAFLRRREQRMQHLDRRLEHLDELEHALVGAVEAAGIAVGVRIALRKRLEPADVDLADERRNVLVVLVARLRLGQRDLAQARGIELHHLETTDVAAELVEPLEAPGAHQAGQPASGNAVLRLDRLAHRVGIEQAERALENGADVVAGLEDIDGVYFHQGLQALGQRGFAAANWPQQVEDLLALFQPLSRVAKEADDPLDRFFHAVKFGESRIDTDGPVHEDAAESGVFRRIDHLGVADRGENSLRRAGKHHRVRAATLEVVRERHLGRAPGFVRSRKGLKQVIHASMPSGWRTQICRPVCIV